MADVTYSWPSRDDAKIIGTRKSRLDGIVKSTGAAKYTYDVNLPRTVDRRRARLRRTPIAA